jgi:hypothetical protein
MTIILASMSEQWPPIFGAVDERKLGQALSKVKDMDAWISADGYLGITPKIEQVVKEMNVVTYDALRQHYGLDHHIKILICLISWQKQLNPFGRSLTDGFVDYTRN